MPLLRLDNASFHYGNLALLDGVDINIARGNKIGLLGRNGAGKTTLLKVLAGDIVPESGECWLRPGTRIAWLQQILPEADEQTVYDIVASGLVETGRLLAEYHHLMCIVNLNTILPETRLYVTAHVTNFLGNEIRYCLSDRVPGNADKPSQQQHGSPCHHALKNPSTFTYRQTMPGDGYFNCTLTDHFSFSDPPVGVC